MSPWRLRGNVYRKQEPVYLPLDMHELLFHAQVGSNGLALHGQTLAFSSPRTPSQTRVRYE